MSLKEYLSEVSVPVYVAVSLFAISSWIDINGVFVEAPLFVDRLPEGWSLFSYLAVFIQVANIGPITYTVLKKICPHRIKEWPAVYLIIGIGAVACFLLALFWRQTTVINGTLHSTALFTLVAFLALVDCTSSVVYLPYMGQYRSQYLTAFYIGEGFSAMIPGFVGLTQGVGSEPDCINETVTITNQTSGSNITEFRIRAVYPDPVFSVSVFFFFLFAMMLVSGISFTLLNFHPFFKKERVASIYSYSLSERNEGDTCKNDTELTFYKPTSNSSLSLSKISGSDTASTTQNVSKEGKVTTNSKLTTAKFVYILLITALLNGLLNGVLPSTQSYTCLPYGSLAYTLAVRLSAVGNPLTCFLALFIGTKSLRVISIVSFMAVGLSAWHLYLAVMSPFPPLKGTVTGTVIVIITQVTNIACIAYTNVSNASILNEAGGAHSLLWFGGAVQIGSCVAAIVTFIFVNVLYVFKSEPPCPGMYW